MKVIDSLFSYISKQLKVNTLTTTYTDNDYVNAEDFGRIKFYTVGRLLIVSFSTRATTAIPRGSYVTIGNVTLPNRLSQALTFIATSTNRVNETPSAVMVDISTVGLIRLYNYSTTSASDWLRTTAVGIMTGGGYRRLTPALTLERGWA